jgi:hypothetical protein
MPRISVHRAQIALKLCTGAEDEKREQDVKKNRVAFWIIIAIVGVFVIWTGMGRPPFGPFPNMGFDSSWDCPPNAKPSATVCIKKPASTN